MIKGFLDQSTPDKDLQQGHKIDLPIWIVRPFSETLLPDTPKVYRASYRQILSADPNVVDLHKLGPYFYAFGQKILQLNLLDIDEIGTSLMKVIMCFIKLTIF